MVVCLEFFCTIICQLLHVDPWKAGVLCPIVLCGLWCVETFEYIMVWRSYSFVSTSHYIVIIVQTYLKLWNIYNTQYIGYVFSLPIFFLFVCTSFCYYHEIGNSNHWPFLGLGHEAFVCALCLGKFLLCTDTCSLWGELTSHRGLHMHIYICVNE